MINQRIPVAEKVMTIDSSTIGDAAGTNNDAAGTIDEVDGNS